MKNCIPRLFLCFLLAPVVLGCRGPKPIADQRPVFVPETQLRPNVFFGNFTDNLVTASSAVVLDRDHLLTNAHVWSDRSEQWWLAPSQRAKRLVFDRDHLQRGSKKTRFRRHDYELVAIGEPNLEQRWQVDWAVVRTETPVWRATDAAALHRPALHPDWQVAPGTKLYVIGFSPIFLPDEQDPGSDLARFESFIAAGPYTLTGTASLIDGQPAVRHSADLPQPGGHSGGGVYLWNDTAHRLELVGVFHSWSQVRTRSTRRVEPLGIAALGFNNTTERDSTGLYYAPLSAIAPTLRAHGIGPLADREAKEERSAPGAPEPIPTGANDRE